MPSAARLVLTAAPNSAFRLWSCSFHSVGMSVTSGGYDWPGYASGARYGDGRVSCWKVTLTEGMPSFSATDRAPATTAGTPVATRTSHPPAAAGSTSRWAAANSIERRATISPADGVDDAVGGGAPVTSARADVPNGT